MTTTAVAHRRADTVLDAMLHTATATVVRAVTTTMTVVAGIGLLPGDPWTTTPLLLLEADMTSRTAGTTVLHHPATPTGTAGRTTDPPETLALRESLDILPGRDIPPGTTIVVVAATGKSIS